MKEDINLPDPKADRLRTYAWSYFAYHSEQRMRTFHFYLITIAALIAGFTSAAPRVPAEHFIWLSIVGFLISFFSVCFAFIDKRNTALVKNGEAALKWLDECEKVTEEGTLPNVLSIFDHDDDVNKMKPEMPIIDAHISYSMVLRTIFWVIGLLGIACGCICIGNG